MVRDRAVQVGKIAAASVCQEVTARAARRAGHHREMRILTLGLPLLFAAACTSGPSKQDASRLFVATTAAVQTAQQKAVTSTQALTTPAARNLDYIGPCDGEGSFEIKGTYDDASGSGAAAAFDLQASFNNCVSLTHTALDGNLHWSSTSDASGFSASLGGSISFSDQTSSAACDLDLHMAVTTTSISYAGTVCGYDVTTDLGL